MTADREDGSPDDDTEQFEVLDEVGEVEGWDGEFPDDDEQDMKDEDEQVGKAEEKTVADSVPQSNKKQETVGTENEPVCVNPSSVKNINSSAVDKDNKEQSEMSLNKESSSIKDIKSGPSVSKELKSNEVTASEDVIVIDSSDSEDEIFIDSCASEDVKAKEASASKDAPSEESTCSAVKRKANNPEAQKPEAKIVKLASEKEDNKRRLSVEENEVISTVPLTEYQISKFRFVDAMIKLSEQLKCQSDYRCWVEKERKDGMVFPVFDIDPPAEPILFTCCQLVSGYENDSTTLCLGFERNYDVLRFSAREAKYFSAVRSTVKAFEEMVQSCSKPLFDPITLQGYWHGLSVIANNKGETLLKVDLYASNMQEGEVRFGEAKDILVKYFSSEVAVLDCHITSIYLRLVFSEKKNPDRTAACCITDNKFISETIGGIKVNLYPWSFIWKGTLAMTSLCEAMLKVMLQENCKTVVELGCGTGIVGQFLAKHCESVLGVDFAESISEARANAEENHLSNCTYFDKYVKDIWTTLDDVLQDKPSVMVIVNGLYSYQLEDPVIAWLTRSNKVCRVVCIQMTRTNTKRSISKSRVISLCTPMGEPKKHHDDPMPYFPLYALPVNLGTKLFATVLVLQHVESNFINELYKTREKSTVKCIRIVTSAPGIYKAEGDPQEKRKCRSTSPADKENLSISKPNDKNANKNITDVTPAAKKNVSISKPNHTNATENMGIWEYVTPAATKNVHISKPNVKNANGNITDVTNVARDRNLSGGQGPARRGVGTGRTIASRSDGLDGSKSGQQPHGDHSYPTDTDYSAGSKNVSVNRDGVLTKHRNERSREFYGRGRVRVYEDDLHSFVEENRATFNNEGKDSFRASSRLPHVAETFGGARKRGNFRDELTSGRNLHPPDVRGKLHSRNNEPEAFPLVKDSALFERRLDSKANIRDERKKVIFDIKDKRSIDADLRGSGPGRSFDDAKLCRRKSLTDDIASGIKTDVRGINIRAGGWKARDDIHNMESIHVGLSKFDTSLSLSNVKSSMKDFQHSWKGKPEFNQSFPNAGTKSELSARSPNSKPQVMGDIRKENPYSDNKPKYFGDGDKSSKAGWFAFNERGAEDGIAERNRVTLGPEVNRITYSATDKNRTHIVGSERNRVVGISVSERRFDRPEKTGASGDGADDRKRQMYGEPVNTKKQVYVKTNDRKMSPHAEVEDRKKLMYGEPENRKKSVYCESEDGKRVMYDKPRDRKRSVYVEPEYLKRLPYDEPGDMKRSTYNEPGERIRSTYDEPKDRRRSLHGEPVDSKRLKYGDVEDKRSVYEEPGDRRRSVYGGPEGRSGHMFSKTEGIRPVVEEVGRNRPSVEEIERNRLMTCEREREKVLFGGRTNINGTGSYAADSKVASYNRDNAEDRHSCINDEPAETNFSFRDAYSKILHSEEDISPNIKPGEARIHQQMQQHSPLPPPPQPPPPPLITGKQMVEVQSTKEKVQKIAALKPQKAQQGVNIPAMQAGGSSVTIGKDSKSYIEEYVRDRSLEKGPQTYWAMDRGCEPATSHQTPGSSWDKVQSSIGHNSTALWTSSWGQEGRQGDTKEQHGTFTSLPLVDTTKPPPSFGQHVGKYGTSDEPGGSTLPSLSTFGQSPQNDGHSYQQYGMSSSAPAQPSAVGTGDLSQSGSWQGGGPGSWNTSSGWSTTGGWGTPGAWNTSNNSSSQSGNVGYTWR